MSIQFCCPGCSHPIEVDDEFAGRRAACPYCQQVVTVPAASTYEPESVPTARPAESSTLTPSELPPAPVDSLLVGAPPLPALRRRRAAAAYANFALACTLLLAVLAGTAMFHLLARMSAKLGIDTASQPTSRDVTQKEISAATEAATLELAKEPWFLAILFGSFFVAIAGSALAIAALWHRAGAVWRSVLALVICGGYVLCTLGGQVIGRLFGAG
ncbi:MAG: hypothetical protein PVJ57_00840 [Phycisphaerae bacterium]|jgi:hypothetical protein